MSRPSKYTRWTTPKIARLRECYPVMAREELAREFAPHPIYSVIAMAKRLGIRKQNRWKVACAQHIAVFSFGRGVRA